MIGMHLTLAFWVVLFATVCLSKPQKKELWAPRRPDKWFPRSDICTKETTASHSVFWYSISPYATCDTASVWPPWRVMNRKWAQCCPKHETEAATCQYTDNSTENPSIDFLGVTPPQLFSQPNAASPECVMVIDQNRVSGLINVLSLLVRVLVFKECPSCYLWLLIKVQSYLNNQCVVK